MKQNLRTFLLGVLALLSLCFYLLSAQPFTSNITIEKIPLFDTNQAETHALKYLNQLRINAGLIPFKRHNLLDMAAKNHANYLIVHRTYGHYEETNTTGFTGTFASNRVLYVGYASPQIIENVSSHNRNYQESIDGLFAAIYHRLAFLDFRSDNIGIGIKQHQRYRNETNFVYDMSSSHLEKLYQKQAQGIELTNEHLQEALSIYKNKNKNIVIYPFNKQSDVPPAFFDELPDPLPTYDVSGYPISVSLNEAKYYKSRLLSFQLFKETGEEILNTLIYDHNRDPHKRLGKLDYVLFPLKRLDWNSTYTVKFSAIVDNQFVDKIWSFKTRSFSYPLHYVNYKEQVFTIKKDEKHIFYFPPHSKIDLLKDIIYPSSLTIRFIDKNTIDLIAYKEIKDILHLSIGNHILNLQIKP